MSQSLVRGLTCWTIQDQGPSCAFKSTGPGNRQHLVSSLCLVPSHIRPAASQLLRAATAALCRAVPDLRIGSDRCLVHRGAIQGWAGSGGLAAWQLVSSSSVSIVPHLLTLFKYLPPQLLEDLRFCKAMVLRECGRCDVAAVAAKLAVCGYRVAVRTALGGGQGQDCFQVGADGVSSPVIASLCDSM